MKSINELLNTVQEAQLLTEKHYSDVEMFGKQDAEAIAAGATQKLETTVKLGDRDQRAIVLNRCKPGFYGNNFATCFIKNFSDWVLTNRPSGSVVIVLAEILRTVRYYNYVLVSPAKLITKTELNKKSVYEAINMLENTGVIMSLSESELPIFVKIKPKGERRWYKISEDLFWKGKANEISKPPKGYKIYNIERDMKDSERKTLEDSLMKVDSFLPEI